MVEAPDRRVTYIHSPELQRVGDALPSNLGRASLVHSLISSYGLLDDGEAEDDVTEGLAIAKVVEPVRARREELLSFHDEDFIDSLLGATSPSGSEADSDSDDSSSPRKRQKTSHSSTSLVDDCPPFPLLSEYVPLVAGASLTAARQLRDGLADVAISWNGGRHHAARGEAKGFCYVNDIVLAIMELRKKPIPPPPPLDEDDETETETEPPLRPVTPKKLSKILYLDLDLHHGDAVESAFLSSPYILTLSLHLHAPLFYPSTGSLDSSGPTNPKAAGRGHALNLALESGLGGDALKRVWETVENVRESFGPDAVVVQCGVDGLNGDPCKEWNLSLSDYGQCITSILEWNLPTLLLGGGGYSSPDAARVWTHLTSLCLNRPLSPTSQIPSSLSPEEYEQFSPSFTLDVESNETIRDRNNDLTLSRVEEVFDGYCEKLREKWKTKSTRTSRLRAKDPREGEMGEREGLGLGLGLGKKGKEKKKVRWKSEASLESIEPERREEEAISLEEGE
ncbi:uncharacterized protein JCM6883_006241 [Sporobolomyces salmoneus]|uniref:uncharacterized protein n=1 Tax=Sporobolomyces salmoneus TaxID=183962 RepID=UPI003172ABE1